MINPDLVRSIRKLRLRELLISRARSAFYQQKFLMTEPQEMIQAAKGFLIGYAVLMAGIWLSDHYSVFGRTSLTNWAARGCLAIGLVWLAFALVRILASSGWMVKERLLLYALRGRTD